MPQVAELASHFMAACGGPKALAKMMLVEFLAAKPGSIIRQRTLDTILRVTAQANQDLGSMDDMDMMSVEDLERELKRVIADLPEADDAAKETAEGDAASRAAPDPGPARP